MSAKPLVSVIIPVFNLEAYLGEAVDSVLQQTCQDFEIILVDDGSTDRSREIISRYQIRLPGKVRALFHDHRGAAAARNAGIAAARGDWIAFLDGDDRWYPHKLEAQLQTLAAVPSANLVFSQALLLGEHVPYINIPPQVNGLKLDLLLHGNFIILPTLMVLRTTLADCRFDESLYAAHDLDFMLRLAGRCQPLYVEEPLAEIRRRGDSLSAPFGSHFLQLLTHYRAARREIRHLREVDAPSFRKWQRPLALMLRRLSHEAAWTALRSRNSTLKQRLQLAMLALVRGPLRPKNWRILAQCVLPPAWNRRLSQRSKIRGEANP